MASSAKLNTEDENNFRTLLVQISGCSKYKQPDLFNSENFYTIYSPKKIQIETERRHSVGLKI